MLLRFFPVFFLFFASFSAQKIIKLSSLKGENVENAIDYPPPYDLYVSANSDDSSLLKRIFVKTKDNSIASLDMLKFRKQTATSGLLQAFPISTSAVITTDLPNKSLESLTGLIYVTTAKQQKDKSFFVYDVDQYQIIQIERNVVGDSTIVFLNTNYTTSPQRSSTISGWLQTQESSTKLYKGIPTDDAELASTHIFSNPFLNADNKFEFVPTVEKFSLTLDTFYIRTHLDIRFTIEPVYFDIDLTVTRSYHTTGFYMKSASERARKVTVLCVRDTRYNGTTSANFVGSLPSASGTVTVQENDGPDHTSMTVTPVNGILGWRTSHIGSNLTISSKDSAGGVFFVQYCVSQGQMISSTTSPNGQTTVTPQTTTRSSRSVQVFIALLTALLAKVL